MKIPYFLQLIIILSASWTLCAVSPVVAEVLVKEGEELVLERGVGVRPRLWTLSDVQSELAIKRRGKRRDTARADSAIVGQRERKGGKVKLLHEDLPALCARHVSRGYRCAPNMAVQIAATPDDTYYDLLYGLERVSAPAAWATTAGSASVVTAVIDTGVKYDHDDLAPNILINSGEIPNNGIDDDGNGVVDDYYGFNAISSDGNAMDDQGHGTHVAGTIAAVGHNGLGVIGVAHESKILAIKALNSNGSGFVSDIAEGIDYAVERGVQIINLSLTSGGDSSVLRSSIERARDAGVLVVAAAGNQARDIDITPAYPAVYDYPNLVSVASTDSSDNRSYFSNWGVLGVHVAAPGSNIASTSFTGGYVYMSGTSMATPHVAGVAALIFSANPSLSASAVKSILISSVDSLSAFSSLVSSGGRVNAARAVGQALGGESYEPIAFTVQATRVGQKRTRLSGRAFRESSLEGVSSFLAELTCNQTQRAVAYTSSSGEFVFTLNRPRVGRAALRCDVTVEGTKSRILRVKARVR